MMPSTKMYEEVTRNFRKMMIHELAANYEKGDRNGEHGWLTMTDKQMMNEIYYHAGKLQAALKDGNLELIREFSADVANLAMMCIDRYIPLKDK